MSAPIVTPTSCSRKVQSSDTITRPTISDLTTKQRIYNTIESAGDTLPRPDQKVKRSPTNPFKPGSSIPDP